MLAYVLICEPDTQPMLHSADAAVRLLSPADACTLALSSQ